MAKSLSGNPSTGFLFFRSEVGCEAWLCHSIEAAGLSRWNGITLEALTPGIVRRLKGAFCEPMETQA